MARYSRAARLKPGRPGRTTHQVGMPVQLGGSPVPMPDPDFVAIRQPAEGEGGVFLDRFTDGAAPAGDTWHQTEQEAVEQAAWEYGERLGPWIDLRGGMTDLADVVARLDHVTFRDTD
jgi:hypothetical protein